MDDVRSVVEARVEGSTATFHEAWAWSLVVQFAVVPGSISEGLGESEREQYIAKPAVTQDHRPAELTDHVRTAGVGGEVPGRAPVGQRAGQGSLLARNDD
jgi:hypothetical protein